MIAEQTSPRTRRAGIKPKVPYLALYTSIAACLGACDASFVDRRPERLRLRDSGTASDGRNAIADGASGSDGDSGGPLVLATGTWEGRSSYSATGSATLVQVGTAVELRLSNDFAVSAVPGPVVVLSSRDRIGGALDAAAGDVRVANLAENSGAQNYPLAGGDGGQRFAWVYCEPFGVEVARAALQ